MDPAQRLDLLAAQAAESPLAGTRPSEETLDPVSWQPLYELGYAMVDAVLHRLETVREGPVWRPPPAAVQEGFRGPAPRSGTPAPELWAEIEERVLPYPHGNVHPRFWGWVNGSGTAMGALADLVASGMNSNASFGLQAATLVERQVVAWLAELLGLPAATGGLLVTGASVANLVGLTVARNARAGWDVRAEGLAGGPPLRVYGSSETHSCVVKAVEVLGLGTAGFVPVATDADFRVEVTALADAIAADRAAGRRPIALVGNAGTVNTGAVDDLAALAALARREGLWLHVDGAFGACARLAPELAARLAGLELADSVAIDLHKWLHVPYDTAAVLVRDAALHRAAFAPTASYLAAQSGGISTSFAAFQELGLELSRGFRALRAWITLREHGADKLGRLVLQNVRQAGHLAALVDAHPQLERLAPAPLNVVCFRYRGGLLDERELAELNAELLVQLQESGVAVVSSTRIAGGYALRAAITNHRTRLADVELLIEEVAERGRRLAASRATAAAEAR
jgi:glutamate/tyrosine decarboxylase-like PLP-dependent enzyme